MKAQTPNPIESWQRRFFKYLESGKSDPKTFGVKGQSAEVRRKRADVYRNDCPKRLRDALAMDFIKLKRKLGLRKFDALAYKFGEKLPSKRVSLYEVSDDFLLFLKRKLPKALYQIAAADLALTKARLSAVLPVDENPPQAGSVLKLAPHCQRAENILYYRVKQKIKTKKLNPKQSHAVKILEKGSSVEDLGRRLERAGIQGQEASRWFKQWTRDGLVIW